MNLMHEIEQQMETEVSSPKWAVGAWTYEGVPVKIVLYLYFSKLRLLVSRSSKLQ